MPATTARRRRRPASPKHRQAARTQDAWLAGKPSIRMTRWIPHAPSVKQHAFLCLDHKREVFYGGAAGGGKSDALLTAALQYVDVPGYAAIMFRRTFADLALPGALMSRSKEWLSSTDVTWNDREKTWTFPSGATLSFGYLDNANDKYRYQSAEFQFIAFDEVTQFPDADYLYLFSRLRRPSELDPDNALAQVPLRMRSASNPGGRGHRWVKMRFIDRATRGQRVFIPAALTDNPHIDQASYEESLQQLDEQTRLQLLRGDWSARGAGHWMLDHARLDAAIELGSFYDELLDAGDMMEPSVEPGYMGPRLHGGIDWGEITQAYAIWPLESGGIYVPPSEVVSSHTEPGDTTMEVLRQWRKFGYPIGEARYDAAGVQSMRTFVKTARSQPDMGRDSSTPLRSVKIPFGNYKVETIKYMRWLLERTAQHYDPATKTWSQDPTAAWAISPRNSRLCDQLYEWERKNEETEDAVKEDDHGPDACVAGIAPIARRHRERIAEEMHKAMHGNGGPPELEETVAA